MDISPDSVLLKGLQLENFTNYLELTEWRIVRDLGKLAVFEGYNDIHGQPLEIVLPKETTARDASVYLAKAINLLSALFDISPEEIIQKIEFYDRDVLRIRNEETDSTTSISLKLAATQVHELKQLVVYSACFEESPKPYFHSPLKIGSRMAEQYRFGHTFRGSFGYTIQSPLVGEPIGFVQTSMKEAIDDIQDVVILPFERRVIERIVRGFLVAREAVDNRNWQILVNKYAEGFNANMCRAIMGMVEDKKSPIACDVMWSSRLSPSPDVGNVGTIRLNSSVGYDYLALAEAELRQLKPDFVTLRGRVIGVSSKGDPQSADTNIERTVILLAQIKGQGRRPQKIQTILGKEDYVAANAAHLNWSSVEVTGVLLRSGSGWQLADPYDFKVVN